MIGRIAENMEKEQVYMSLETGEVVDDHYKAMSLYRDGHEIQILYRVRHDGEEWGPFTEGAYWAH